MFITELFDSSKKILVVYPGRFQPWHKGHRASYHFLTQEFGDENVYIATTDKVDPPRSPFNYQDKIKFISATGINTSRVIQTKNPYKVEELVSKFDPQNTVLIFGISDKDMAENPRFNFNTLKSGSKSYFQPYPGDPSQCEALAYHGYITTVPTYDFVVAGKPMRSATEFRANFATASDAIQKVMIRDLFGIYSPTLHRTLKSKLNT